MAGKHEDIVLKRIKLTQNVWYCFRWDCNLHYFIQSNMHRGSTKHRCLRGNRTEYNAAICSQQACPKLKP